MINAADADRLEAKTNNVVVLSTVRAAEIADMSENSSAAILPFKSKNSQEGMSDFQIIMLAIGVVSLFFRLAR